MKTPMKMHGNNEKQNDNTYNKYEEQCVFMFVPGFHCFSLPKDTPKEKQGF